MRIQSIKQLLSALAALTWLVSSAAAQQPQLTAAFQIIERAVSEGEIPGAAVLIMRDGRVLATRAYGKCDIENDRPFQTDTICWIASLTKPVTVAAAMTLVEQGRLGLDDPVEKYLPGFRTQRTADGRHVPITVRQLMCHASGIQTTVPLRPRQFFTQSWYRRSLAEVADAVAGTKLVFDPGERAQYSNAAPYVLGRIVELVAQKPFGQYVRERILEPLEMTDTGFAVPADKIGRAAVVYRRESDALSILCRYDPAWDVRMTMPDGGLFSTPLDMARFANAFLPNAGGPLAPESIDEMRREQKDGYGLGWILDAQGQYSHWGSSGTRMWADPATRVVGVVFFQIQHQRRVDAIQQQFREAVTQRCPPAGRKEDK